MPFWCNQSSSAALVERYQKVFLFSRPRPEFSIIYALRQIHPITMALLNYHDAIIYPSDLSLLDSKSEWLNDSLINFQMTRLQQTQKRDTLPKANDDQRGQKCQREDSISQLEDLFLDPWVYIFICTRIYLIDKYILTYHIPYYLSFHTHYVLQ